jgi:hypothetical protein
VTHYHVRCVYILSFTDTIFMYQAQLINTEILSDQIKRNNKYNWTHIYAFSGRRNQYTNTNAVFIPLRRWLYRDTLSCAMCFIIALTLYKWTYHVNVKYHKSPVRNCHSEDKHTFKYRKSIYYSLVTPSKSSYLYIDFEIYKSSWICIACSFYFLLFVAVQ